MNSAETAPRRTGEQLGYAMAMQALLFLLTLLVVDTFCYFFLPDSIANKFYDYRRSRSIVGSNLGYRPGYLVAHSERGHDIGPGMRSTHEILEHVYPIWSNKLGCFDREWDPVPAGYVYFAGDSFTWGYSQYDSKFATLFERITGRPSLKCGVTSTGTRHQFEKFKDILAEVKHPPRRVIVSFFTNDIAGDYVHPLTTVVDGWLVDRAYLDEKGNVVEVDDPWLREKIAERLKENAAQVAPRRSLWTRVKEYSATANVANGILKLLFSEAETSSTAPPVQWHDYQGRRIKSIYDLEYEYLRERPMPYRTLAPAEPNRAAIRAWRNHARQNGYQLSFMLIPPPQAFDDVRLFNDLKAFLSELGIESLDLAQEFARSGFGAHQIYWRYDGHFAPLGNRLAAEGLARRWGN